MKVCRVQGCERPHEAKGLCHSHYATWKRTGREPTQPIPTTPDERFWAKVNKTDECWLWTGATGGEGRYGMIGRRGKGRLEQAHRVSYEMAYGPIPEGLVLDHLCRVTLCVRPDHLEAVTQAENIMRGNAPSALNAVKTHCKRGHPLTPDNIYVLGSGGRMCKTCNRLDGAERQRRYRARKRAQR